MIPDHCTLAGIRNLIEVLNRYSDASPDVVRARYLRGGADWDDVLAGAVSLQLIATEGNRILLKPEMFPIASSVKDNALSEDSIKEVLLSALLGCEGPVKKQLRRFIDRFELVDGNWQWSLTAEIVEENLGLRNLLIELEILAVEYPLGLHTLNAAWVPILFERFRQVKISPRELEALMRAKSEIGRRAELAVLAFERTALIQYPQIANRIRHVADEDVTAGFDILSFAAPSAELTQPEEKYIEVKAISLTKRQFYLSKRELQVARQFRNRYHLYLVPILGSGEPCTEYMEIIADPAIRVLENEREWVAECEAYQITPRLQR